MIISLDNIDKNYYCTIKYRTNCRLRKRTKTNDDRAFQKNSICGPSVWLAYLQLIYEHGPSTDEAYVQTLNKKGARRDARSISETSERRAHPWIPRIFWVVEKQSSLLAAFYSSDSCCGQNLALPFHWRSRIATIRFARFISGDDTLLENDRRPIRFDPCLFFSLINLIPRGHETRQSASPRRIGNEEEIFPLPCQRWRFRMSSRSRASLPDIRHTLPVLSSTDLSTVIYYWLICGNFNYATCLLRITQRDVMRMNVPFRFYPTLNSTDRC